MQVMRNCYSKPEAEWIPLTQALFRDGTLRLRSSGCYYLAEDIEFGPNEGCCDYWPRLDNGLTYIDSDGQTTPLYPMGPYSLGFFAAITIEADDIVLDLNGKTVAAAAARSQADYHEGGGVTWP